VPDNRREENFWVALGDNFFYGRGLGRELSESSQGTGCSVFTYEVSDPSQYGVAEVGNNGDLVRIVEKPDHHCSSKLAVTGLYRFDSKAHEYIDSLTPSERGELEITSLLNCYASSGDIELNQLPRGTVWLDMGSFEMLHEASGFVKTLQNRTGLLIGDPKEASRHMMVG
jgi:glucose-1-phosphate thymidylyltransferase